MQEQTSMGWGGKCPRAHDLAARAEHGQPTRTRGVVRAEDLACAAQRDSKEAGSLRTEECSAPPSGPSENAAVCSSGSERRTLLQLAYHSRAIHGLRRQSVIGR